MVYTVDSDSAGQTLSLFVVDSVPGDKIQSLTVAHGLQIKAGRSKQAPGT